MKGSRVDRFVKGPTKPSTTLKDLNFIRAKQASQTKCLLYDDGEFLQLPRRLKYKLRSAIRKDVSFLSAQGLMDYSLFLAVEESQEEIKKARSNSTLNTSPLRQSVADKFSYYMSQGVDFSGSQPQYKPSHNLTSEHCFCEGNFTNHIAIIDYLQEWSLSKKAERFVKTKLLFKNAA